LTVPSGAPPSDRPNDPDDDNDPRSDGEMDFQDLRDYEDQDPHVPPTTTANLGPYACFLENMPDFINLTQEEYNTAFQAAFNRPIFGPPPPGISIHEAIQASYYTSYTYPVVCRV
jgi:hypothetical protein